MFELIGSAVSKVLGGTTKNGENQLLKLFEGDKEKERKFQIELNEQFQARLELELKDRMSARDMQIAALKQDDKFSKRFLYYLTMGIVSVTALLGIFPLFVEVPPGNEAMVTRATDFFYMIAGGSVIGFFFGTNNNKDANKKEYGK